MEVAFFFPDPKQIFLSRSQVIEVMLREVGYKRVRMNGGLKLYINL